MLVNKTFQGKVIRFIHTSQEHLVIAKDIWVGSTPSDELKIVTAKFEVKKMALKLDTKTRLFYVLRENAALYYLAKKHATQLHNFIRASFAELRSTSTHTFKSYMNWLSDGAETCIANNNIVDLRRYTNPKYHEEYSLKDVDLENKLDRARVAVCHLSAWLQETYPFTTNGELFWRTCSPQPEDVLYKYLDETVPKTREQEDPALTSTKKYFTDLAATSKVKVQSWPIPGTWTLNESRYVPVEDSRNYIMYDYTSDQNEKVIFKIYA